MSKVIKLMENMKVGTFTIYDEGVYNRNLRWFRIVPANEVTSAMCRSAGIPERYATVKDVTPEVKKAEPVKAPDVDEAPAEAPADTGPQEAPADPPVPDYSDWSEEALREYAQEKEIPTHPAAKKPGLIAAITRYHDELEKGED